MRLGSDENPKHGVIWNLPSSFCTYLYIYQGKRKRKKKHMLQSHRNAAAVFRNPRPGRCPVSKTFR